MYWGRHTLLAWPSRYAKMVAGGSLMKDTLVPLPLPAFMDGQLNL